MGFLTVFATAGGVKKGRWYGIANASASKHPAAGSTWNV
jgi:hypothetical protein